MTDATLADEDDYSVLFVADYQHLHDATGSEQTEPDIAWFPKTLLFPSQMVTLSKPDPTYFTKPDLPNPTTKVTKPTLADQLYRTKVTKTNIPNQAYPTKPNLTNTPSQTNSPTPNLPNNRLLNKSFKTKPKEHVPWVCCAF